MVAGLGMTLKWRGLSTEYGDMQDYYCITKQRKWLDKYNFDLKRYLFLRRKLDRIEAKLEKFEQARFVWIVYDKRTTVELFKSLTAFI